MSNKKIVILAGGKGTRMESDLPKVLYPLKGKPLLSWLLGNLDDEMEITLVVGFQSEKVKDEFGDKYNYVLQKEQLGTGHAVGCVKESLKGFEGDILVLYGDHPLVSQKTVDALFDSHSKSKVNVTLMTAMVDDFEEWRAGFYNFGRILRNDNNDIVGIKELVDSSDEEKEIKEINPAYFCFKSQWLWENIDKLKSENNQQEYYLTDLIALAFEQGIDINSVEIDPIECLGVNTKEQVEILESII